MSHEWKSRIQLAINLAFVSKIKCIMAINIAANNVEHSKVVQSIQVKEQKLHDTAHR